MEFFTEKAALGLATPLDSAPTVGQEQHLYYAAFWVLLNCKQGEKISIVEMESYSNMFPVCDVHLFVATIQALSKKLRELKSRDHKN